MCRMNCSLWRAIRLGYTKDMVRYCRAWGWGYFWHDTFIAPVKVLFAAPK